MSETNKSDIEAERHRKGLARLFGSAPWFKPPEKKHFRAKVFKSGNSLALRLPAELDLSPGTEMDLTVEDGMFFSFEPVETPKRKFNIAKVCGSATNLEFIEPGDRTFEERRLLWNDLAEERDGDGDGVS